MTKAFYILLSCLILVHTHVLAQGPTQPVRLELEMDSNYSDAEVIALPDSSLLLYTKRKDTWGPKTSFEFTKYNHLLKKEWSKIQDLDSKSEYTGFSIELPYIYLAFDVYASRKYKFLKLHIATGESTISEYEIPEINTINEFQVLSGQYFAIGNNRKDYKPAFFHINSTNGEVSPLPSVYGNESYFSDLQTDSEQGRAYAVLLESNGRVSHLQVKSFNALGKITGTYFTPPQRNRQLQQTEITPGDTTKLLIGAYGINNVNQSTGIYTMPLQNNAGEEHFYSFLDLKNSLKHLNSRHEKRIRRKEQNRLEKRKSPNLRYQLLLHDLVTTSEGYILAAEVYSTHHNNIRANRVLIPDLPGFSQDEIYKHSHVLVLAFNKTGELLWDNSFKLNNIVTKEITPTVEVASAPDGRFIIAYPDEKKVVYSIINRDTYTSEKTTLEIKSSQEGDKITAVYEHGIINWYGGNFAAFGFQQVRSASGGSRGVFYINKIAF